MLEYLLLGTFVVVVSVTALVCTGTMKFIGKACYRVFLPSAKGNHIKHKPVLLRLSETLEGLPMPWGWCPAKPQKRYSVQTETAPVHVLIPWGWPGNLFQDHRHNLLTVASGAREDENPTADVLQFPAPRGTEDLSWQNPCLDIKGTQYGGFRLVAEGSALRDARLPWGW